MSTTIHCLAKAIEAKTVDLNSDRHHALSYLCEAHKNALEVGSSPSSFACQLAGLQGLGISDNVLRWLVAQGFATHQLETTRPRQQRRTFRASENLCFTSASCFVATAAGLALLERLAQPAAAPVEAGAGNGARESAGPLPHYDASRRLLSLDRHVIKHFKVRAELQELILLSFEEEHWPPLLADPIPGKKDVDAKRRLNGAIRNLNAHQVTPLLRFHGDGTGTGICWETVASRLP